jgi:hypothetical protein
MPWNPEKLVYYDKKHRGTFTDKHLKVFRPYPYSLQHGIACSQLPTGQVVSCSDSALPLVIATPLKVRSNDPMSILGCICGGSRDATSALWRGSSSYENLNRTRVSTGFHIAEARLVLVCYPLLFYLDKQLSASAAKRLNGYRP